MCCDYLHRRFFCGISTIGAIGGFATLMYGVSNLPNKLPDTQINWGGQIISQPNGGSAQDLQDYIHKSYEYKLVTIGGIVMGAFIVVIILISWFGLCPPPVRHQRRVLPTEVEKPTIQVNIVNSEPMRIRSPSSHSPQLTQYKFNKLQSSSN